MVAPDRPRAPFGLSRERRCCRSDLLPLSLPILRPAHIPALPTFRLQTRPQGGGTRPAQGFPHLPRPRPRRLGVSHRGAGRKGHRGRGQGASVDPHRQPQWTKSALPPVPTANRPPNRPPPWRCIWQVTSPIRPPTRLDPTRPVWVGGISPDRWRWARLTTSPTRCSSSHCCPNWNRRHDHRPAGNVWRWAG